MRYVRRDIRINESPLLISHFYGMSRRCRTNLIINIHSFNHMRINKTMKEALKD